MRILVLGKEQAFLDLIQLSSSIKWLRADDFASFDNDEIADAYFNLLDNAALESYSNKKKPIFINSVSYTLIECNHSENVIRFNGWNGFIKRELWEMSGKINHAHEEVLNTLGKKYVNLPDEPGFISPRVISMIVNEAFFAKQENISTEKEIDIAMKLGTNYPKGPFEWEKEIGSKNIYFLLNTLSQIDPRYKPSNLLESKAGEK